jgi:ABC-2 type transport system permease protein
VAVHKRAYRPYDGPLTAERWRFLVILRYALGQIFASRFFVAFLIVSFVPILVQGAMIYIANSEAARTLLGINSTTPASWIRPDYFLGALTLQGSFAFFLTAWVAPTLVSPDLVNGALPLYLSRPLSRGEYVLGKMMVLLVLLSLVTWLPLLLLFGLQAGLAEGWLIPNLRIAFALVIGSWIWISVLTLVGLALSACIRWRIVATGGLFAVFFMGTAFGEMWANVLLNPWGRLGNLTYLIAVVWRDLFGIVARRSVARNMLDDRRLLDLPPYVAWMGLVAICALCLWLLHRRLQAREVVA